MPEKCATKVDATSISKQLIAALGEAQVLQIARECRWLRRLPEVSGELYSRDELSMKTTSFAGFVHAMRDLLRR